MNYVVQSLIEQPAIYQIICVQIKFKKFPPNGTKTGGRWSERLVCSGAEKVVLRKQGANFPLLKIPNDLNHLIWVC